MLTQKEQMDMHNEQVERARAQTNPETSSTTIEIQRSVLRELWTALLVWDRAEYGGGRERAAGFLASVVRDALVNFKD